MGGKNKQTKNIILINNQSQITHSLAVLKSTWFWVWTKSLWQVSLCSLKEIWLTQITEASKVREVDRRTWRRELLYNSFHCLRDVRHPMLEFIIRYQPQTVGHAVPLSAEIVFAFLFAYCRHFKPTHSVTCTLHHRPLHLWELFFYFIALQGIKQADSTSLRVVHY